MTELWVRVRPRFWGVWQVQAEHVHRNLVDPSKSWIWKQTTWCFSRKTAEKEVVAHKNVFRNEYSHVAGLVFTEQGDIFVDGATYWLHKLVVDYKNTKMYHERFIHG